MTEQPIGPEIAQTKINQAEAVAKITKDLDVLVEQGKKRRDQLSEQEKNAENMAEQLTSLETTQPAETASQMERLKQLVIEYEQKEGNEPAAMIARHLSASIEQAKQRAKDWKVVGLFAGTWVGTSTTWLALAKTIEGTPAVDFYRSHPGLFFSQIALGLISILGGGELGKKLGGDLALRKSTKIAERLIAQFSPKKETVQEQEQ